MLSLFSSFKQEELCQLYIYPTLPDIDRCQSYFRITDKDVLKSYYQFKVKGREIAKNEIDVNNHEMFEKAKDEALYRNKKNKKPFRTLLRDTMWKYSHWCNKSLKNWLEEQKPTCIFVAPGQAKFLYRIALKLSKKYKLPIVSYICDEYYFVKKNPSFLGKIQQNTLKKSIKKLVKSSVGVVTICDELKECYEKEFSIPTYTVMTGSNYPIAEYVHSVAEAKTLTYMGNIRCNRYKSLVEIGKALDKINQENGTNFSLELYTAEKDEGILSSFDDIKSVKKCGFISGEAFEEKLRNAELLLHVEAFDKDSVELVKHSVSTKIADSLGSGVCFFAYGPKTVASMQHLIRNDCALVCTDGKDLGNMLMKAFYDAESREKIAEKALETARKYHDSRCVSERLYTMITEWCGEDSTN